MRDRLILPDRPVEHDALLGVVDGTVERGPTDADRLDAREHALGVERVEDVIEAAADLTHDVFFGNLQAVDEDLVAVHGGPAELLDLLHGDPAAVELGEEQREVPQRSGGIALARAG